MVINDNLNQNHDKISLMIVTNRMSRDNNMIIRDLWRKKPQDKKTLERPRTQ